MLEYLYMLNWMAWTTPSAVFFIGIASILLVMTIWEIRKPCVERKGWLPIATTRGDRIFIGLLSSAFVHLLFLGLTDFSLWVAFGVSALLMLVLLRWG
jgi:predicted small integral membrane protein